MSSTMWWSPHQELIWVKVEVGEVVLKAGVEVWGCLLWSHQSTGSPRTEICIQTWTAGTAGPPARSEESLAFQKYPGTRLTGLRLLHRARSCPSCHFWSEKRFLDGGKGPESGEGLEREPESVQRRKTGTAAGRDSSRIYWLLLQGETLLWYPGSVSSSLMRKMMKSLF